MSGPDFNAALMDADTQIEWNMGLMLHRQSSNPSRRVAPRDVA